MKGRADNISVQSIIASRQDELRFYLFIANLSLIGESEIPKKHIISEFSRSCATKLCGRHDHLRESLEQAITEGIKNQNAGFTKVFQDFIETSAKTRAMSLTAYFNAFMQTLKDFKTNNYRVDNLKFSFPDNSNDDNKILDFLQKERTIAQVPDRLVKFVYENNEFKNIYQWASKKEAESNFDTTVNNKVKELERYAHGKVNLYSFIILIIGFITIIPFYKRDLIPGLYDLEAKVFGPFLPLAPLLFIIVPGLLNKRLEKKVDAEMKVEQQKSALNQFKVDKQNDLIKLQQLLNDQFNIKFVEREQRTSLCLQSKLPESTTQNAETEKRKERSPATNIARPKRVRVFFNEPSESSEQSATSPVNQPTFVEYESSSTAIIRRIQQDGYTTTLVFDKSVRTQMKSDSEYKLFKRAFKEARFADKPGVCIKPLVNAKFDAEIKIRASDYRVMGTKNKDTKTITFNHYQRGLH